MKKKLQLIGFFFLFTLSSRMPLQATINNYPNVKTLRTEIVNLIKKPDLSTFYANETTVKLSFLVSADKEVVVINAETDSPYLEEYVKKHLNYQKIKTDFVRINKVYHIKLIFKKSSV